MTDHKAEAEKLTAMKYAVGAPIGAVRHNDALAQVHATLYLAEQQRIANLIAGFDLLSDARPTSMDVNPQTNDDVLKSYQNAWDRQVPLRSAIKEGLGL